MLKSAFQSDNSSLNVLHLNPGGLRSKLDEFRDVLRRVNVHCIAISETHFKSYTSDKSVELNGFFIHRNDRELRRCGGVALYVKKGISSSIIRKSVSRIGTLEYIFVELCVSSHKILFGVMYKPPGVDDIAVLDDLMQDLSSQYAEVIIAGDFNEDLIDRSAKTVRFMDVVRDLSLDFVSRSPTG